MKSITIHNIDEKTSFLIEKLAKKSGLSLNKTIKMLLQKALGHEHELNGGNDFEEFLGIWSKDDFEEFEQRVKDLNKIDAFDW